MALEEVNEENLKGVGGDQSSQKIGIASHGRTLSIREKKDGEKSDGASIDSLVTQ